MGVKELVGCPRLTINWFSTGHVLLVIKKGRTVKAKSGEEEREIQKEKAL